MQHGGYYLLIHLLFGFNPHPSRRTGATHWNQAALGVPPVSILTRPGGRVQHADKKMDCRSWSDVSILTRPGGRVQPQPEPKEEKFEYVSILTRPGGRVQRTP